MRRPLLAYAAIAVPVARHRRRIGLPRPLGTALAASVPVAVAGALPRGRGRAAAVWAAQMWAYKVSFEVPYDKPEKLRRRLRVEEPARLDTRLGGGVAPPVALQRRFRDPDRVNRLDRAVALLYFCWEAEPHAAMAWILARHPERFTRAALRLGATFDLTLLGYWLAPTAPPWRASEKAGLLDGEVRRVPTRVIRDLRGEPLGQDDEEGANPWAAFPSDHFASALMTAVNLWKADRRAGIAGGAYAVALGAALVYLGEHYVGDLAGGLGLVLAVLAAEPAVAAAMRRYWP